MERDAQSIGIWADGRFRRLWSALTIALFGAQIATLALPLAAAFALGASPWQMGLLAAAGQAPFLLCSLPFGVWVDRAKRRRCLLVGADLGRATLLLLVPAASLAGVLRLELLYAAAFLVGVLNALFDVTYYGYVPALIGKERLPAANGGIQAGYSAAEAGGPGLAGILVQLVTAPLAVVATVLGFLASAILLGSIPQPPPPAPRRRAGFRAEIAEGMRALLGHPLLRPIVIASGLSGLGTEGVRALYLLYATRELGLSAFVIGLVLAVGGGAAAAGGLLAARVTQRIGFGPAIFGGWVLECGALLVVPLAHGHSAIRWLVAAQLAGGFAGAVANVNQWSLRQLVTPDHLQARVTASHRCLVYGAFPLGALLGGLLASAFGLRPALVLLAAIALIGPLSLVGSPLIRLRELAASVNWTPADASPRVSARRAHRLPAASAIDGPVT